MTVRAPRLWADQVARLGTGDLVLTRAGELELVRQMGDAVWITDPPSAVVPFYQRANGDGTAAAADLLLGCVGEVVGCGARHETGAAVRAALAAHGVGEEAYEWYVLMKEARPMATAGFGLGIERLLLWVLRHDDIRDLQVMPRLKGVRSWL